MFRLELAIGIYRLPIYLRRFGQYITAIRYSFIGGICFTQTVFLSKAILSILAFVSVALLIYYTKTNGERPIGYVLVLIAVVVIAINTMIQKHIAAKENITAIMFVSSLSSLFWGGIRCWQSGSTFQHIETSALVAIFGLAVINLAIFYLVNELYKQHEPALVRYPYLIAAFGTMCVEMLIKQKWLPTPIIVGNILILATVSLLVKENNSLSKNT